MGASTNLRPAADDYCFGSVTAQYGVIDGVIYSWNSWSGFAFSMALGNLFVGLPLAVLPFSFASAIPFLSTALAMGCLIIAIADIQPKLILKFLFISFIAFCWWSFLWVPMSIGGSIYFGVSETNGLTFWQTLNGTYVIQLQILIGLFICAGRFIGAHRGWMTYSVLAVLTGGLAGFSGTALSVSVAAFSGVMFIGFQLTNLHNRKSWKHYWLILGVSTAVGLWICHACSPGNHLREQAIGIHMNFSTTEMVSILFTVLLQGFRKWAKFYLNLGGLSFFVLIFVFSFQMAKLKFCICKKKWLWYGFGLAFFALLQCFVSRLADQLTYIAYWHYISALVCVFLSIYLLASYGGCWLHRMIQNRQADSISMTLLIGLIILGAYGNSLMAGEIRLRGQAWERGPAHLEGVSDIEDPTGWQMDCWKKLDAHRDIKTIRN